MKFNQLLHASLFLIVFVTILVLFNACKRNKIYTDTDNSQAVTATIFGRIIAEDGTPMKDVAVQVGTHTFVTDSTGIFYFSKISSSQNATLISATKINYFTGYRTLKITPNKDHYTRIMLIEKTNAVQFDATTGATVNVNGGGTITFPSNAIAYKNDGTPYSGIVTVYSKWLDPTANNLPQLMPGDLRGVDSSNTEKILQTFGMIEVELFDNANQPLQIATTKTAQLSFPIPSAISMNAPSVIPLWFFDTTTGLWKEEGSASKQGNNYVGDVKHFSFWNCDMPGNFVNLELTLTDNTGRPLVNTKIKITNPATGAFSYGSTNSSGFVSGLVPDNATLTMEVIMYPCLTSIYSQTVNTLSSPISLGTIAINPPVFNTAIVTGTVLDCTGNPVSNGFVTINGLIISTNASGTFNATLTLCSLPPTVTVAAYDMSTGESVGKSVTISSGVNNLGTLSACGDPSEYIIWTSTVGLTSTTYSFSKPLGTCAGTYDGFGTAIAGSLIADSTSVEAAITGPTSVSGTHNIYELFDCIDNTWCTPVSTIPVTLIKYEGVGGIIEGSFTGDFTSATIPLRTISCNFKVRRQ